MTLTSLQFVLFVASLVLIYYIVPKKTQWCVLLAAGLFFYWMNSHWLILYLIVAAMVAFFFAQWIGKVSHEGKEALKLREDLSRDEKKALKAKYQNTVKRILWGGIVIDFGIWIILKYYGFFMKATGRGLRLINVSLPEFKLLMPLGISFYTLQAVGYMVDVYRGKQEPDRNLLKFLLFMSFFPQIVQGPIARYNKLAHQLYEKHRFDYSNFCNGIQLILWGFMKKLIIADRIAIPTNQIFTNFEEYRGLIIFMGAVFYGLQVYTDFSGGMDIARGVSQILGIELELNFAQPYFARSVEEFWRRWHITLGSWMRDYVFYPLSLSSTFVGIGKKCRKVFGSFVGKRLPSILSMFIVYIFVGWWHGAQLGYIAYGIWNGVFISSGILLTNVYTKMKQIFHIDEDTISWKLFQMFRTFVLISVGRLFSKTGAFKYTLRMLSRMKIDFWNLNFLFDGSMFKLGLNRANWNVIIISVVILLITDYLHEKDVQIRFSISRQHIIVRWTIYIAAVVLVLVFGIWGPKYQASSFIYGDF